MDLFRRGIILCAAVWMLIGCAREPEVKPGMYETVASWQYPIYRQYTEGYKPIGTGVSLLLHEDSTYEYASFQMNVLGRWDAIDDTLYLHCDSVQFSSEIPLEEYYKNNPTGCPNGTRKFVIGRNMLYKHYSGEDGVQAVMILEKVQIKP